MAIKHILFDLDGTLTDSQEGIVKSLQYALDKCGYAVPSHEELTFYIGPPLPAIFEAILQTKDPEVIDTCVTLYRERFSDVGLFENKVYEGIVSLLKRLNGSCALYVATSKPQVYAKQIIAHFDCTRYFNNIYGSNLDNTLSNKSELIGHLVASESLNPDECIMIGDRNHDIIGALENGITPIGVAWGYGSITELEEAGCDKIAHKPSDIIELI